MDEKVGDVLTIEDLFAYFKIEIEAAIQQLVSRAVSGHEVVDIFAAAGFDKPNVSILLEEFLAEVRELPQNNLAVETLKKLLQDEIKVRLRKNVAQSWAFAQMLEGSLNKYHNRAIDTQSKLLLKPRCPVSWEDRHRGGRLNVLRYGLGQDLTIPRTESLSAAKGGGRIVMLVQSAPIQEDVTHARFQHFALGILGLLKCYLGEDLVQ